jgi:hypothetical protein
MNDFLSSVKSDLLDRRMLPILVLVGIALAAAVAYALLAGGGSSASTQALSSAVAPVPSSIAVTQTQAGTGEPVAETTSGTAHRSVGSSRNPFAPLPGAKTASATTTITVTAGGSSAASESSKAGESPSATPESSSGSSGGGTSSPEANKPAAKGKAKVAYRVAVRFGTAAAGTPAPSAPLTAYDDLERQQPLPDAKQPLIVFRGVIAGGKSATFTLVGELIPRGGAKCLPSVAQCQAIDLKAGAAEELEYVPLGGTAVTYELEVVKIERVKAKAVGNAKAAGRASAAGKASTATVSNAANAFEAESKAGAELLRQAGLTEIPGLRDSADGSVLVFERPARDGLAAGAHAGAWVSPLAR